MKTVFYILIVLFMSATFTACTTDNISDNVDLSTEEVATEGDEGQIEDEDVGGGN